MKQNLHTVPLFRATIIIHDVVVMDKFYKSFSSAESWCYRQLDKLCIDNPWEDPDVFEALIVPVEGVVL